MKHGMIAITMITDLIILQVKGFGAREEEGRTYLNPQGLKTLDYGSRDERILYCSNGTVKEMDHMHYHM